MGPARKFSLMLLVAYELTHAGITLHDIIILLITAGTKCRLVILDGWMSCNFTSFLTVFLSYQNYVKVIMEGCVHWNPVYF